MALLGEMGSSEQTRRRQDQGQVGCTGQQPHNCHGMETDIQWTLVNPALVTSGPDPILSKTQGPKVTRLTRVNCTQVTLRKP
jgi:hypothetical protein